MEDVSYLLLWRISLLMFWYHPLSCSQGFYSFGRSFSSLNYQSLHRSRIMLADGNNPSLRKQTKYTSLYSTIPLQCLPHFPGPLGNKIPQKRFLHYVSTSSLFFSSFSFYWPLHKDTTLLHLLFTSQSTILWLPHLSLCRVALVKVPSGLQSSPTQLLNRCRHSQPLHPC